ncbi:MAG TPA: hypothetical protein VIV01_01935, partial [Hyphomicrobiaceae bacterium]
RPLYFRSRPPSANSGASHKLGNCMAAERFYVYRSGESDACALTGAKDDPRLPLAAAPDRWRFWMQIGRLQAEGGRYGFNIETAASEIAANGYCLFTGSRKLLGGLDPPPTPPPQGGTSDA